ncbi:hypothetical protein Bbelb_281750 [Branchiostoma belcheri]|nr:hypothetical protein Bbelb_281750 [Branchiostoma belcheri]
MEPCAEVPLPPSSAVDSEAEIAGHEELTSPCALYRDTAGDREGIARNEHEKTPYALYQNTTVQKEGWGSRNTLISANDAVTSPYALYQDTGNEAPTATSHLYGDKEDLEESSKVTGRKNGQDKGQEISLSQLYSERTGVENEFYQPAPPCEQNATRSCDDVDQNRATTHKQAKAAAEDNGAGSTKPSLEVVLNKYPPTNKIASVPTESKYLISPCTGQINLSCTFVTPNIFLLIWCYQNFCGQGSTQIPRPISTEHQYFKET